MMSDKIAEAAKNVGMYSAEEYNALAERFRSVSKTLQSSTWLEICEQRYRDLPRWRLFARWRARREIRDLKNARAASQRARGIVVDELITKIDVTKVDGAL